MVFYLKYRPQTFNELDIVSARERLVNIFSSGRWSHAFLFSGPRGTGKTSAARIVAKAVNCEKRGRALRSPTKNFVAANRSPESSSGSLLTSSKIFVGSPRSSEGGSEGGGFEPCNQCLSCKAITAGTCLDVLEIDAASNRGIDEIRELREKIKLAPIAAKYKVYIIDEVHMLTTEAFNALLKTLEEPPAHAIFILATTRADKLPETVISRCVRIDFRQATDSEIIRSLERMIKGEKLEIEKGALEFIAQQADGSFRDATKILEESALTGKITLSGVKKLLGREKDFSQKAFLDWLSQKETKKALQWLIDAGEKGIDYKVFTERVLEQLHGMLMAKFGVANQENIKTLKHENNKFSVEELKELIRLFSRAHQESKTAVIPSLPLELAVVEWGEKKRKA